MKYLSGVMKMGMGGIGNKLNVWLMMVLSVLEIGDIEEW